MKKSDVKVGAIVEAKSEEELKHKFQGRVEKIYENSALLAITSFDPKDAAAVNDLNNKMVINFKNLKAVKSPKTATATSNDNDVKISKLENKK
ncbi:DUF2187 family protein [Lactobacillus psittaci]|uniref:DUF2187 domain-containing protein n=1 Tax=Lactobacillus psittaci DSM 15354 TaxID=1122152 RepID=A0A0R1SB76_9LACO|nr:DUF2187 family protein [Lactobacillus psittaci]KRL63363.1 hypothetical protein FC23_GL000933 [Lactobacillus psittaci DSM 15354]